MNPARAKVEEEGRCRVCGYGPAERLEAAHVWDRSLGGPGFDDPDAIVPLCAVWTGGPGCHDAYDAHELDLLPYLTTAEQVALVRYAGSIQRAYDRARGRGVYTPRRRHPDDGPLGLS